MRRPRKIALSLASLVLLFFALELFCRFYLGLGDPPLSRPDPEIEYMFVGPRTYHRFGNTVSYNSLSMRSREFDHRRKNPDELRILVVGDSVINGGALTDQKDLATTRLERHLADEFHRPTIVMNVSAGSWGPPNYLAYVKRNGTFEANALIIVVSSHDAADAPTFEPIVGISPDFPDHTPTLALTEALTRYLPRYLPHFGAAPAVLPPDPPQGAFDQSMGAFRELIELAESRHIPVIVAQHFELSEYDKPETEGHRLFRLAADDLHVPQVELSETFAPALKAGKTLYRDAIHPNAEGQVLMEQAKSLRERIPTQ